MNATDTAKKAEIVRALLKTGLVLTPLCNPTPPHEHGGKPCKTPGKVPLNKRWGETRLNQYAEAELSRGNYGIVLQAGQLVIDVDPRNFTAGDKPLSRLAAAIGGKLDTFVVKTGGGGYHLFLTIPPDLLVVNDLKEFPGIEFKSVGRQVVAPGSVHESGGVYSIAAGDMKTWAPCPEPLIRLIERSQEPSAALNGGTGTYIDDRPTQERFLAFLDSAPLSVEGKAGDHNAFKTACRGRDFGLSPIATWTLMLKGWNDRCLPPWTPEELKEKVAHAYRYAAGAVGAAHPAAAFDAIPPVPVLTPPKIDLSWDTSSQGQLRKSFNNLVNYMKSPKHGLYKVFGYNEFTGRVEFVNAAPWHHGMLPDYKGVGDNDLKLLKGHLAIKHGFEMAVQHIEEAVTVVANSNKFHPVREYLTSLEWDKTPRIDTWLTSFLGVVDTEYSRAVARKTLCAAVMRVMHPGIKFDHVLVLEGAQDIGKSSAVEILGGKWAADAPVDPHSRDTVQLLQGRWIVELAEMEVTRRADAEALKAFITRRTDMARLAYGRTVSEFPRQSIFIATKNPNAEGTYLKDDTGNRRWWPVRCNPPRQIDFRGLKDARNMLFAEAIHRVKTLPGEKLFMETDTLKDIARHEAGLRHAEHEWTECVAMWIAECDKRPETRRDFLTARDVFLGALGSTDRAMDRKSATSIAGIMRTMGWPAGFKRVNGVFCRGYMRPSPDAKGEENKSLDILSELL